MAYKLKTARIFRTPRVVKPVSGPGTIGLGIEAAAFEEVRISARSHHAGELARKCAPRSMNQLFGKYDCRR